MEIIFNILVKFESFINLMNKILPAWIVFKVVLYSAMIGINHGKPGVKW